MIQKIELKRILFLFVLLSSVSEVLAQVSLREISLQQQIEQSSLVVEGEVVIH